MASIAAEQGEAPVRGDEIARDGAAIGGVVPFVALDREHAEIAAEMHAAVDRVVRRNAFILGEEVELFESAWAAACGTAECVGTSSGTAALTLLLRATGIEPGDEVVVPAHTYIATALAVVNAGAVPVLCDVDDATGLMDPDAAAAVIGPRTAALMPVHLYGQICEMDSIARLAARHGVALIEDAAQAHGAERWGQRAGGFGAGAGFSFYPSKNLGAIGDAGAICTNDTGLATRARRLRNLGQHQKGHHVVVGYNDRLDGLQAAILRLKLGRLEAATAARREHAVRYRDILGRRLTLLHERRESPCVYHLFPVRVAARDVVMKSMGEMGIQVGVHYALPLHRQPALADRVVKRTPLPRAEAWAREELSLPMSPRLRVDEIERAAAACAVAAGWDTDDGGRKFGRRRTHA